MKFGPNNHRAGKLSPEQVQELYQHYHQDGWSQGKCARSYGISVGQVGRIVRGESWQEYTLSLPQPEAQIVHQMTQGPQPIEQELQASIHSLLEKLKEPPAPEPSSDPLEVMLDAQGDQLAHFRRQVHADEVGSGTGVPAGVEQISESVQPGNAAGTPEAKDPGQNVLADRLDGRQPVEEPNAADPHKPL